MGQASATDKTRVAYCTATDAKTKKDVTVKYPVFEKEPLIVDANNTGEIQNTTGKMHKMIESNGKELPLIVDANNTGEIQNTTGKMHKMIESNGKELPLIVDANNTGEIQNTTGKMHKMIKSNETKFCHSWSHSLC